MLQTEPVDFRVRLAGRACGPCAGAIRACNQRIYFAATIRLPLRRAEKYAGQTSPERFDVALGDHVNVILFTHCAVAISSQFPAQIRVL